MDNHLVQWMLSGFNQEKTNTFFGPSEVLSQLTAQIGGLSYVLIIQIEFHVFMDWSHVV